MKTICGAVVAGTLALALTVAHGSAQEPAQSPVAPILQSIRLP